MVKYLVDWVGWPSDEDTWEREEHLNGCQELLQEFKRKKLFKSSVDYKGQSTSRVSVLEDHTGSACDGLPSPSVPPFVCRHVAGPESQPGGEGDVAGTSKCCLLLPVDVIWRGRGRQPRNRCIRSSCRRLMRRRILSKIVAGEIWTKNSCWQICVSLTGINR